MAGTLLVLNPAFGTTDPKVMLGGQLLERNPKVVRVWTDNWNISNGLAFPLSGAHGGMIHLYKALLKYRGTVAIPTQVITWSRGGEIADKLLRELGSNLVAAGVDPATVELYLCGDPETKYVGASYVRPTVDKPVYPGSKAHNWFCPTPPQYHGGPGVGSSIPTPMVWKPKITYVIQEFDGHADAPIDAQIPEVAKYFTAGDLFCPSRRVPGPHGEYKTRLDDPTNVSWTDPAQPHVTYMWLRTKVIPSMPRDTLNWNRNEYERIYPLIQPGHSNRPVALPMLAA